MKRFSFLPLCCALIAGCSAPATQSNAAPAAENTVALAENTAPAAPETKTYRLADNDRPVSQDPDQNAAIQAALKKVALPTPPLDTKIPDRPRLLMTTSKGPITLELDAKAAPLHVRSFLYLVGKGFYNGVTFHRYADLLGNGQGFIIQGGDPLTKSPETAPFAGVGGPGYEVPREYNDLKHRKLVIAAARSQNPDSAGSQFYITQGEVPFLDENEGYTVFGRVIKGDKAALSLRQDDVIKSVTLQK